MTRTPGQLITGRLGDSLQVNLFNYRTGVFDV
jgi:hypothetical protein